MFLALVVASLLACGSLVTVLHGGLEFRNIQAFFTHSLIAQFAMDQPAGLRGL